MLQEKRLRAANNQYLVGRQTSAVVLQLSLKNENYLFDRDIIMLFERNITLRHIKMIENILNK